MRRASWITLLAIVVLSNFAVVAQESGKPLSAEDRARLERRKTLELSLARTRDERSCATRTAHKAMLDAAITALEAEISALTS